MSIAQKLIAYPPAEYAPPAEFADAMSALASGVVLVTCRVGDRPWGMTVTAFASVSSDPPTVLVSLDSEASSLAPIQATRRFGVSILASGQEALADYAATPGATKFLEPFVEVGHGATPAVAGALAHLDCDLSEIVEAADHVVLFGHVRAARRVRECPPLVYHRRAYRTVSDPATGRKIRCLSS
jgi:flavin reductase (DIM6/NTAB) family NADH-FMN oxidoreductase RutF